jgi:uncharacterized membrane protein
MPWYIFAAFSFVAVPWMYWGVLLKHPKYPRRYRLALGISVGFLLFLSIFPFLAEFDVRRPLSVLIAGALLYLCHRPFQKKHSSEFPRPFRSSED